MSASPRLALVAGESSGDLLAGHLLAALRAHTIEGAISIGREDDLGSLEVGKYADFAVLGADPLTVDAEQIAAIPVRETWVDGERRHRA